LVGGAKMENFCDVILVTFFGGVIVMTSLKCSKVVFRHNQLETSQFGKITKLQITNVMRLLPALGDF